MAKTDWDSAAKLFAMENERTGISVQDWCERNGLNYQSARRYLKTRAQSATTSKTSRTAAQSSTKNPKKNAQSAQKSVRKSNAQKQTAQSAQCANDSIGANDENNSSEIEPDNQSSSKYKGRDEGGRFVKGEYEGNPNPVHSFPVRHQYATKHSGYAKYFPQTEYFDDAELMSLHDELTFTRARVISVTKNLQKMHEDLSNATEIPDRIALYGKITAAEQALDRNVARVESLTRTLSAIRIDDVNVPRLTADTDKIKAQTDKLRAETDKLGRKSTAESVVYNFDW